MRAKHGTPASNLQCLLSGNRLTIPLTQVERQKLDVLYVRLAVLDILQQIEWVVVTVLPERETDVSEVHLPLEVDG